MIELITPDEVYLEMSQILWRRKYQQMWDQIERELALTIKDIDKMQFGTPGPRIRPTERWRITIVPDGESPANFEKGTFDYWDRRVFGNFNMSNRDTDAPFAFGYKTHN